jgi:hypothetical protein
LLPCFFFLLVFRGVSEIFLSHTWSMGEYVPYTLQLYVRTRGRMKYESSPLIPLRLHAAVILGTCFNPPRQQRFFFAVLRNDSLQLGRGRIGEAL